MVRARRPGTSGGLAAADRGLRLAIGGLLCATGVFAQDAIVHEGPYTGREPRPVSRIEAGEEPLALWSLRILGSTLKPREDDVSYTTSSSGGCFYVTAGDAYTVWNSPILLPNGAVVDTLRIYYIDTSASNLNAWFTIYDLYGDVVNEWIVVSSGSSGNGFADSSLINHTIDHGLYSYAVNVRPIATGSTMQFCGIRIFYVPPAEVFFDGFESGDMTRWTTVVP